MDRLNSRKLLVYQDSRKPSRKISCQITMKMKPAVVDPIDRVSYLNSVNQFLKSAAVRKSSLQCHQSLFDFPSIAVID